MSQCNSTCCHIVTESAKLFTGMQFEENWVFYHDALSLMTDNNTVEWIRQNDNLERWILPVNKLHQDNLTLSKYSHQPVGNSPENMPWDSLLNQDAHSAVQQHILLTLSLAVKDSRISQNNVGLDLHQPLLLKGSIRPHYL